MSEDIVKRLRNTPNWMREEYAHYKDGLKVFDRAPFEAAYALEAQAAEITRLRAERNAEISARFKAEGEFSTMQRRIARQRRALAKLYQRRHNKHALIRHLIDALATERDGTPLNPDRWRGAINDALTGWMHPIFEDEVPKDALHRLIQHEITTALDPAVSQSAADLVTTARREGMGAMAEKIAGWHENAAKELEAMEREFRMIAENLDPDAMQSAMRCAQGASQNRQRAAAIRAAAGEVK